MKCDEQDVRRSKAVTITHMECDYCGQAVIACRECHKRFHPGTVIVCVDNPHEGTPWAYKHYCDSCRPEITMT